MRWAIKGKAAQLSGLGGFGHIDLLVWVSMECILSNLIGALKLGELMMAEELTWQATCAYVLAFAFVLAIVLWLFAKALTALASTVRAWRDALK